MYQQRVYAVVTFARRFNSSKESANIAYSVPAKGFRPPYYHPLKPRGRKSSEPFPPFPSRGDASGMGPRLYDYQVMSELVRSLRTASERIDFVNPYERDFTRREKRFHRPWQAELLKTRKAWRVQSVPNYFDPLHFYQFITKTRCIEGLNQWYTEPAPPLSGDFEERLAEMLKLHLDSTNVESEQERTTRILQSLLDLLLENVVQSRVYGDASGLRISHASRCESFWVRCGFDALYEMSSKYRHRGDNRAKLGELAFVLRDTFASQVRSKQPLKPILKGAIMKWHEAMKPIFELLLEMTDFKALEGALSGSVVSLMPLSDDEVTRPLFSPEFDVKNELIYSPAMFGMFADAEPLWQCPGYEPDCGEECKYGVVGFKQCNDLDDLCKRWKVKGEEDEAVRNECLRASAVVSLFSWLNAQAHALGFTQYNDIEYPLVSQLVLSDGKKFFFAVAQLNTLLINVDIEGIVNNRSNLCYVEGPLKLYNDYNSSTRTFDCGGVGDEGGNQFSPRVLARLMQLLLKDMPVRQAGGYYEHLPKYMPVTFENVL